MPSPSPLLLPVLLVILLSSLSNGEPDLSSDTAALLAFHTAVGLSVLPWNSSAPTCSWQGVSCDAPSLRVVTLHLPAVGLIGQIPPATLSNLTALRSLSLRFNALSGPLPPDLSVLSDLRNLYLQQNRFSGAVPASLSELKNLIRLNLAGNQFSGVIPPEFGNLVRLGTLYLENNRLVGELPPLELPKLVQFNVSGNQLNGSVPPALRLMPSSSFLGTGLCGGLLGPCADEIGASPVAEEPAVAVNPNPSNAKKRLSGGAIAAVAIGVVAAALILLVLLFLLCRRTGRNKTRSSESVAVVGRKPPVVEAGERGTGTGEGNGNVPAQQAVVGGAAAANAVVGGGGKKLVFFGGEAAAALFDLEELLRASAEVLGKGTFGTAYKAELEMGLTLTVKRLKEVSMPEREFRQKIEAVGALEHRNLVPLRAYYYSKDEKLLVYDYMSNGSLSALLHGNRGSGRTPLNWETRVGIALGAAHGIEYIHSSGLSVSHGNIKSSNILLTNLYEARVSDHGLAVLVGSLSSPNRIGGYRAPEVTDPQHVSQKADVYSFGVVLLELLTGKAPSLALLNEEGIDLPRWVKSVVREEWTSEVFDMELLRYQNVEEEMVQLLQLAIDCAAQHPNQRPSISEVVMRIEEIKKSSLEASDQYQQNDFQIIQDGNGLLSKKTDSNGVKTAGAES